VLEERFSQCVQYVFILTEDLLSFFFLFDYDFLYLLIDYPCRFFTEVFGFSHFSA